MDVNKKKFQRITCIIGVFLLVFTATACQDRHIFHYGTTEPSPAGDSFLVVGDSRSGDWVYRDIMASMSSSLSFAACMIHTGDMINDAGNLKQWEHFLHMTAPLAAIMPWYGTVGNHDVNSLESQKRYQDLMDFPGTELYYSFDTLGSHFIVLDTEVPGQVGGIVGEQLTWLKQDLQTSAASAHYLFVFTHRSIFPQGRHRGKDLANADELHQLFMHYGVDIVFSSHEHQYYRYQRDSIHYVVTGGGGAPLYDGGIGEKFHHYLLVELLPPDKILLHVMDVHGKVIQTEVVATPESKL